jgi:hypothetical protein
MLMKESHLEALGACSKVKIAQRCEVKKMDLIDMGHIEHAK